MCARKRFILHKRFSLWRCVCVFRVSQHYFRIPICRSTYAVKRKASRPKQKDKFVANDSLHKWERDQCDINCVFCYCKSSFTIFSRECELALIFTFLLFTLINDIFYDYFIISRCTTIYIMFIYKLQKSF